MAMTYEESNLLMQDPAFRGRVKVAALTYAQYLSLEPATNAQMRWIQNTMAAPDQMAMTLTPPTVMNPNVQTAGAAVTDEQLQAAVQAVANQFM
jgi:hypothetical protein